MPQRFLERLLAEEPFASSYRLQAETLQAFYARARNVLAGSCRLRADDPTAATPRRNFFSTLFLVVTRALVGDSRHMPLYAMVNQGMRAWVTACDNLLDNEYKEVFAFDLPGGGWRMKSVLTLLLADRVICGYVADTYHDCRLLETVESVSLRSLMSSALQEHEEEGDGRRTLSVEEVMSDVHRRKTGDLFEAPLALPLAMEKIDADRAAAARDGLHQFGLACQVLDDVADIATDLARGRPNVLAAIICRDCDIDIGELSRNAAGATDGSAVAEQFSEAVAAAQGLSLRYFRNSFTSLEAIGLPCPAEIRCGIVETMFALLNVPRVVEVEEGSA